VSAESRHSQVFKRLLAERCEEVLEAIGGGLNTWDLYNEWVGRLRGLREAERLSDDADRELNGGS
jgi:hypothetical protein